MYNFNDSDCQVPPHYSPSSPAPSYSCEPGYDEQRLQQTPRRSRPLPSGSYIKKSRKLTVVLDNQEDGSELPIYGRRGLVSGTVWFEDNTSISEVNLMVEGTLESTSYDGGPRTDKLINTGYELWTHEDDSGVCPTQIPFSCILPTTYESGGKTRTLPPSYHIPYTGNSNLFVRSQYSLTVIVTRTHRRTMGLWNSTKRITIPFNYHPRTRSDIPIVHNSCFFSSVKVDPEQWYQSSSVMKTRKSSTMEPIQSHIFIPAGRVYGLSDTIPFHVQLTGPVSSLREFLSSPELDRVSSVDSHAVTKSHSKRNSTTKAPVRVFLLRQTSVGPVGKKVWRETVIGEGTLHAVPPLISSHHSLSSEIREAHLDWDGEMKCNDEVVIGGFTTENVSVKDFIVLLLSPSNPLTSHFLELKHATAIGLVTDSCVETTDPYE